MDPRLRPHTPCTLKFVPLIKYYNMNKQIFKPTTSINIPIILFYIVSSKIIVFFIVNCYVCSIINGQLKLEDTALTKSILENTKCFLLDCGAELFVWVGRVTQVEDRKAASSAVEVNLQPNFIAFLPCSNISYLKITSCRNSLLKKIDQRQQE